jgi:hypothetical protein
VDQLVNSIINVFSCGNTRRQYWIWHIRNDVGLILVLLCIQPFPDNMLRIRIFHTVDPFEIWNDQLGHPKECVKN